jgi:hypothetical protein
MKKRNKSGSLSKVKKDSEKCASENRLETQARRKEGGRRDWDGLNGNGSRGAKRGRERSARRRDGSDFRHSNGFAVSGSHRQASVVNDLAASAGLFCESGFSVGRLIDTRKLAIMPTPTRATASRLKPKLSARGGWPRARAFPLVTHAPCSISPRGGVPNRGNRSQSWEPMRPLCLSWA